MPKLFVIASISVATLLEHRLSTIVGMNLQNAIRNIFQLCVIMDLHMASCMIYISRLELARMELKMRL